MSGSVIDRRHALFGTLAAAVNYTDRMEAERREALATSLRKARA